MNVLHMLLATLHKYMFTLGAIRTCRRIICKYQGHMLFSIFTLQACVYVRRIYASNCFEQGF